MKKLLIAIALCSLFCIPVLAQDTPAVEIFGGYSFLHTNENVDLESDSMNLHGFIGAVEGNVHPNVGIVGEFSFFQKTMSYGDSEFTYDERIRHTPFLFGPRFSYRSDTVRVFGHYLLGGARTSWDWGEGSDSTTGFAQAIGGGIDIAVNETLSIRPAQFDYVSVRVTHEELDSSTWLNGFRYSGGVVVKF